jgi:hypothetical protein
MKRKTVTLEATFFVFSYFYLFTTNVTRALSLKAIKGEAGATFRASNRIEFTSIKTTTLTHTHHPSKKT